jgi:hypothetical protein
MGYAQSFALVSVLFAAGGNMSLRRMLRRASGLLILGISVHFASALPQGGLRAQTAPRPSDGSVVSAQDKQKLAASAIKLPLFFEANEGQTDPSVRFLTRSNGYTMFLKPTETVLVGQEVHKSNGLNGTTDKADLKSLSPAAEIRMELLGANRAPKMSGGEELRGKVNYLIGNDPRAWHMGIPIFAQVKTEQVYPGVDLLFHGNQRQMEYDFVVAPGADARKVAFKIVGAKKIEIDADGDLVLHTKSAEFKMRKPVIYQEYENGRRQVRGGFVLSAKNEVRFEVGRYDHSEQLVIDPAIGYSTFLGGNGSDQPFALAVDSSTPSAPKVYVAGYTTNTTTFLDTLAPKITTLGTSGATSYGFVAKIDPTITVDPGVDTSLDYLTFVGGSTAFSGTAACDSELVTVSVDTSQGVSDVEAVTTGLTDCSDYPGTKIQDISGGIANVATRLTASGTGIDVSVLLGGNGVEEGAFASVDGSGNVLIGTATSSTNMPFTSGAYITTLNNGGTGTYDCYIAKLPQAGFNPPSYLTYLNTGGGSTTGDTVTCGAIEDSTGKIDAGGNTVSATAFNVGAGGASLANGFQKTFQGTQDIFLMKLDPTLSGTAELVYGTYYGGGGVTVATNGALDLGNGVVAVGGYTTSATTGPRAPDVPLANAYQSTNLGAGTGSGETGFLAVMDTSSTASASLLCSTYFGGGSGSDEVHAVTYDAGDPTAFRIILGGQTSSPTSFPTLNALQSFQGVQDGFVASLKVPLQGQSLPASLYFSSPVGGGAGASSATGSEQIVGVGVDANHTIYAAGLTISANFFGNLTLPVPVNGFQTSCTSCGDATPLPDAVVFSILQAPGATLQSISITPSTATIAVSGTQQFQAQGFYSDGTITDITTAVAWTSSSTGIATMSGTTPGLAIGGTTAGITTITAALSGVTSTSVTLTVTFTMGSAPSPALTIAKIHSGNFTFGETGATYTVTVSNAAGAGPTSGTVTVTDTIPSGLTLDSMSGTNWSCDGNVCTNSDVVAGGASYPPITVTVDVSTDTSSPQVNSVQVTGGGSASATATDSTIITSSEATPVIVADFGGDYEYQEGIDDKQRIDGKTAPLQVVLTNTSSTQTVNFTGVTVDNPAYTVGMNCTTLAPGQTCIVTANFTATSTCQNQFGDITVQDNDPGGNLVFSVNGFGADTAIQVDDLTDSTLSVQALAQSLVGTGVTISNVTYTGSARAAGNFNSSTNILGFASGIVLSTGSVRNVVGPNCVSGSAPAVNDDGDSGISVDNVQPGDAELDTIVGADNTTYDAAVLEFDFVPTSSNLSFQYVFASDEYNEFVGEFNDVFGFFLTAPDGSPVNIALIPGTSLPVSINNVNDGNPNLDPPYPPTNSEYYINNEFLPSAAPLDTEMNGLTTTFTAQATVVPGQTYHIKLAIADANDHLYDSNVFLQAGSLSSANVTANPTSLSFGSQAENTTSASQLVTITNVGTTTVTISSIVASANFGETNTCPATLTAGGGTGSNCTVNVNFTPSATGTLIGTVTVTYTSTGSTTPQTTTITLTGTGTPATGGTVTVTPSSLAFGSQAVSSTSAPLSVTVTSNSTAAVNFTGFTVGGANASDFAVPLPNSSTGCSPTGTLAAGASCIINVVFTPQANGPQTATLNIADNATGSPQMVALSGTGVTSSVIIAVAPGGSTTATTVSGGTAYYGLMISGASGVTGTVQLGCVPSSVLITCKVIPGSVTLNGGSTEVAFAIQTFCQGTTTATGLVPPVGGIGGGIGLLLVTMVFGGAVWMFRRKRRVVLTFATLLLVALGSAACNSLPSGPNGATPAGTYTLSLTTSLNGGPPQTLNNFLTLVVK